MGREGKKRGEVHSEPEKGCQLVPLIEDQELAVANGSSPGRRLRKALSSVVEEKEEETEAEGDEEVEEETDEGMGMVCRDIGGIMPGGGAM